MKDEIDVSYVRVISLGCGQPENAEDLAKDAILLIPRMEGLSLQLDGKMYKLVKMERVIAIEERK